MHPHQEYIQTKVKLCNASVEGFRAQYNGQVFRFKAGGVTEVPAYPMDIAEGLLTRYKERGLFAIYPNMSKEQITQAHHDALRAYRDGFLKSRIRNYYAQQDEFKKRGITLEKYPEFEDALRFHDEITHILRENHQERKRVSFLNDASRDSIGIKLDGAEYVVPEFAEDLDFRMREAVGLPGSPAEIKVEQETQEEGRTRRGRPPYKHLQEVNFEGV